MNRLICQAIAERKVLYFIYGNGLRVVEPYCHGYGGRRRELFRGFQVRGQSTSGETAGWKFFFADRMTAVEIREEEFKPVRDGRDEVGIEFIIIECQIR